LQLKKNKYLFIPVLFACIFCTREAFAARESEAISRVKLQKKILPESTQILQEIWATDEQLKQVRTRAGFPVTALLNQSIQAGDELAQVNYMNVQSESWLGLAYSNLIQADGVRSFIFTKGTVLIQIAATSLDLEYKLSNLLGADPIYTLKLRLNELPSTWEFKSESISLFTDLGQLQYDLKTPLKAEISQEFLAGHGFLEMQYFHCENSGDCKKLARTIAESKKPYTKMLIGWSGTVLAVIRSQNEDLNRQIMSLLRWPNPGQVQMISVQGN
jgi:hypothetical protein